MEVIDSQQNYQIGTFANIFFPNKHKVIFLYYGGGGRKNTKTAPSPPHASFKITGPKVHGKM